MRILILGGGQVGSTVAKNLVTQADNAVTVIDIDEAALKNLGESLDIQTLVGNAASPTVLAAAGAEDTDLLLALTRSDETNLVACSLAKHVFNIPARIARVRHGDIVEYGLPETADDEESEHSVLSLFSVSESICPEQLITEQLFGLFQYATALQVLNFAHGTVQMVVTRAQTGGLLVGRLLGEIHDDLPDEVDCQIFAIYRNDSLILPTSQTKLIHGDEVFFLAPQEHVPLILKELHPESKPAKKIMIAGGGNIGFRLARQAESLFDIKIIERNPKRADWLSENLSSALVLSGSGTDENLLSHEHVEEIDVFCALTNDDEDNIMSGLLAKNFGANRVISIVNRSSYVDLLQGNTIDIVVSPHLTTIGSILAHIRRGDIVAVHPLRRGEAEIIEAVVHGDRKTSKIIGRPFSQIKWPHGCQVAAVVRDDVFFGGHHEIELQEGDHVIFFVSRRQVVHELEKMLQVKLGFF
ncbi:MAG: Trk system potassium transporter TrkA [Neisseria sp.]|nr:Trk system potassium transporter TrkA [Neisseria sp.]